jgi:hypothetical protein
MPKAEQISGIQSMKLMEASMKKKKPRENYNISTEQEERVRDGVQVRRRGRRLRFEWLRYSARLAWGSGIDGAGCPLRIGLNQMRDEGRDRYEIGCYWKLV